MLLSASALATWLALQTLFGWWGLVSGFVAGGLFCLGMALAGARRAATDPGRWLIRCGECGAAVPGGGAVCRRCGGLAAGPMRARSVPARPGGPDDPGGREPAARPEPEDGSLAGLLQRATAPAAGRLDANYTWRNWAGALLIVGGLAAAAGASVAGWPAQAAALTLGVGGGLAVLRWLPASD
jgi:hypothetical protein